MKKQLYMLALFFMFACNTINPMSLANSSASSPGFGIKEIFKDIPTDQLAPIVQQGQDYIDNASPEELKALEEAMMDLMNNMSEEDFLELMAIAEAVEDQIVIKEPKNTKPDTKPAAAAKTTNKIATDDSITGLLSSINKIIDTVLIRVESDALVAEYFATQSEKSSIALLQRCISQLNSKQNLKKLSDKNNESSKKLVAELKTFKKNISEREQAFHLDDAFGATNKAKSSYKENIKQLDQLIEHFNTALEALLPQIEAFVRLHESEMQELAAVYEKLKESSQKHAKSAQVKKGSAAVKPTADKQTGNAAQQAQQAGGAYNNGYYPYDNNYYGDDWYPSEADNNKNNLNKTSDSTKQSNKPQRPVNNQISAEESTLNEILDLIEQHAAVFNEEDKKNIINFHANAVAQHPTYPSLDATKTPAPTPTEYADNIAAFSSSAQDNMKSIKKNKAEIVDPGFVSLQQTLETVYGMVRDLDMPQAKKLDEHQSYRDFIKKAKEYTESGDQFLNNLTAAKDSRVAALKVEAAAAKASTGISAPLIKQIDDHQKAIDAAYDSLISEVKQPYKSTKTAADILQKAVTSAGQRRKRPRKQEEKAFGKIHEPLKKEDKKSRAA